jgi:guanine deaminase
MNRNITGIRGAFLDCIEDPFFVSVDRAMRYRPDGLLVLQWGKVLDFGSYAEVIDRYPTLQVTEYRDRLITPGLIDTHLHFPQTEIIASYGEQLLEWLERYTFPTERKFQDPDYAAAVAEIFLDELLRHGTTTAMVFAAVFPESVTALFQAAKKRNLRLITGKVMMDRHAPEFLRDTAESSYIDSLKLIETWHGCDRLSYAVTPRFAPTSTPEQLRVACRLLNEVPDLYLQSHLSENVSEIAWVRELFPECNDYLEVYEKSGLVRDRSIYAHGVHLSDSEFHRLSAAGATIAFCPTSNLFLGSGLFKIDRAISREYPVKVGLATDVGGGTSFSLLQTANEAYKVAQLQGMSLSPFQLFYWLTLGGARSLSLDRTLGNFTPGKEADFVVWCDRATPLMAFRNPVEMPQTLAELHDRLFSLILMGDDRSVDAVYVMGDRQLR